MDFRQTIQPTSRQAHTPTTPAAGPAPASDTKTPSHHKNNSDGNKLFRILSIAILFGVAILIIAVALVFTRVNSNAESKFVDTSKYQAVFLNNGQVYFGKITNLNSHYVALTGIFYLTQASTATTNGKTTDTAGSYTLVKLGCQQIHDPYDQMLINRDQVTFWENIQNDGKVVASINEFQKQNPKGPDCSQVSNQTQATSGSTTQGSTTPTTPSTTTTKP